MASKLGLRAAPDTACSTDLAYPFNHQLFAGPGAPFSSTSILICGIPNFQIVDLAESYYIVCTHGLSNEVENPCSARSLRDADGMKMQVMVAGDCKLQSVHSLPGGTRACRLPKFLCTTFAKVVYKIGPMSPGGWAPVDRSSWPVLQARGREPRLHGKWCPVSTCRCQVRRKFLGSSPAHHLTARESVRGLVLDQVLDQVM
jgi:hypothetical protein